MSIKIDGGDGTAENVIKAGTSNELLYNDKEVLLKENFDLGLGLDLSLLPDLAKAQEFKLWTEVIDGEIIENTFTVPKDGWIVKVKFGAPHTNCIKIDGFGKVGMTPSQEFKGIFRRSENSICSIVFDSNCPYPVKKGQVISRSISGFDVTVRFAPCKGL